MAKVTLIMTASLDGYVVKPDGMAAGSMREPPELKRWKLDRISRAGVHAMGRVTYEEMIRVWPTSKDPYAAPMNAIPKVVFSKRLKTAEWPVSTIARGGVQEEIALLKKSRGGEIIAWGGATFTQALVQADLIDEYARITSPVACGAGKPLFANLIDALEFRMLSTTSFPGGHMLRIFTGKRRSG